MRWQNAAPGVGGGFLVGNGSQGVGDEWRHLIEPGPEQLSLQPKRGRRRKAVYLLIYCRVSDFTTVARTK